MISFIEEQSNFNLSVSRIARFNAPTMDAYRLINRFNADPKSYNCKMSLDSEGYVIVTCNAVIESGAVDKSRSRNTSGSRSIPLTNITPSLLK